MLKFGWVLGGALTLASMSLVSGSDAKAIDNHFAALSYSESTHHYAVGLSADSWAEAYEHALKGCGQDDCFVRAAVQNGCLALARDGGWDGLGFASDTTLEAASEKALTLCYRPWQNHCGIEFSMCTFD